MRTIRYGTILTNMNTIIYTVPRVGQQSVASNSNHTLHYFVYWAIQISLWFIGEGESTSSLEV